MEEDGGEEGDEGEANDEDAELPSPRMSRQPHRKSIRSTAKLSLSPPPQDRHVQRSPGDEEELLFPPSLFFAGMVYARKLASLPCWFVDSE